MRFKKGIGVEVMEKGELPFESWRPAKIVNGNGHTYVIKYDNCGEDNNLIVSKVPRKLLRPRPPPIERRSCNSGDVVEVFENYSWRLAEILGTLGRSIIVAKLLGSSKKVEVPLHLMRVPSIWKDDRWTTNQMELDKHNNSNVNNKSKGGNLRYQIPSSCPEALKCGGDDTLIKQKYDTCAYTSRRGKKRHRTSFISVVTRASKKKRSTYMGKDRGFDDESTSSVGSCSINNGSYRSVSRKVSQWKESNGLFVDDAESFSNTPKELINHKLALDSYCSTIMSLYESGSLNWEQELFLTNLRRDLHITTDEHLSTIRHLLSTRR